MRLATAGLTTKARGSINLGSNHMPEAEFHLHNEAGIRFPPLRPAYSDGDLYFGRFRALIARATGTSVIGEGGTGRIHLVRDELMDREVALKIPLDSILRDPSARADVIQETRQAMELTHPNIVRIHDFHESDRLWGISMQQVRGKNLDEWRYENTATTGARRTIRPYAVEAIRDWIAQLCDALRYAHEDARMVHRDIKPKNLMLERRDGGEKLLITDFGITQRLRMHNMLLSRDQSKAEETKGNMGTLPYMPWEQIAGGQPSPLDDVYAVGATIYELITGRPPFYEGSYEQIKIQIKETPPPSMEERLSQFGLHAAPVPHEWEEAVAACLAKRPEDRPQSIRELMATLGFQSGADTRIEALAQSQRNRILELEGRIEALGSGGAADSPALQQELDAVRGELESVTLRSGEAERQLALLCSELERARQELDAVQQGEDSHLQALRDQSAAEIAQLQQALADAEESTAAAYREKIVSLEAALARSREDAGAELQQKIATLESQMVAAREAAERALAAETAKLRKQTESLQERLSAAEQSRAQGLSAVREEAEKRLQDQAEELHKARQVIAETGRRNEELDRQVAAEKNRQAASLRPLLVILLVVLILGLGGGFASSKMRSGGSSVTIPDLKLGEVAQSPVTYEDLSEFARALGIEAEALGIERGTDGEALGVNGHLALQYCDWLTKLAKKENDRFSLPTINDLKIKKDTDSGWIEWSSEGTSAGLKVYRHGKNEDVDTLDPVPLVVADPKSTFRLKLISNEDLAAKE